MGDDLAVVEEKMKGYDGKVTLLIWMIGLLIGAVIMVGTALWSQVQQVQVQMARYESRQDSILNRVENIERLSAHGINTP